MIVKAKPPKPLKLPKPPKLVDPEIVQLVENILSDELLETIFEDLYGTTDFTLDKISLFLKTVATKVIKQHPVLKKQGRLINNIVKKWLNWNKL